MTKRCRLEEMPDALSIADVAAVLGISRNVAYQSVHRKEFHSFRVGRRLLVPKMELQRVLRIAGEVASSGTVAFAQQNVSFGEVRFIVSGELVIRPAKD